ncbi:MAG: WG repeat-containing protein [Candidatus Melainabacteria bacterium]|nr:MAG: WG repeat-containing protein [Candidatus Melainabacteria bacterium]
MTEFREKVEQPELVVHGESTKRLIASEQASESQGECQSGVVEDAPAPGPGTGPGAFSTSSGSPLSGEVAPAGKANPVTDSVTRKVELIPEKKSNGPTGPVTPGLNRHRAIIGACIALSLAVFGLSFTDLSSLFEKSGKLNSSMQFTANSKQNKLQDNLDYIDDGPASEGLRAVRSSTWEDNISLIGFADETGTLVVPRNYIQVSSFKDGLAAVKFKISQSDSKTNSDHWGYIDKKGQTILAPIYTYAGNFQDGVAPVVINDFGALIDKNGKVIRKSTGHGAPARIGNLFSIKDENGFVGMVDAAGNYVVPPKYERIEKIAEDPLQPTKEREYDPDFLQVWLNGRCGLLDQTGKTLIPPKYESISTYNRGYATVTEKGNCGMVDSHGNYLLEPKYKLITMYDDVIAALDYEQNWRLFDSRGKLLPTKIDGAIADHTQPWLYDGMGAVIIGDKCGYINSKGEIAIRPQYDYAIRFSNEYGLVQQKGVWHYLDRTGNLATDKSFVSAKIFNNGNASVAVMGPLFEILNGSKLETEAAKSSSARRKFQIGEGNT